MRVPGSAEPPTRARCEQLASALVPESHSVHPQASRRGAGCRRSCQPPLGPAVLAEGGAALALRGSWPQFAARASENGLSVRDQGGSCRLLHASGSHRRQPASATAGTQRHLPTPSACASMTCRSRETAREGHGPGGPGKSQPRLCQPQEGRVCRRGTGRPQALRCPSQGRQPRGQLSQDTASLSEPGAESLGFWGRRSQASPRESGSLLQPPPRVPRGLEVLSRQLAVLGDSG